MAIMGRTMHIYFSDEYGQILDRMDKGEISSVCQKAVKEWDSYTENLESLKKKIAIVEEEHNTSGSALKFLKERFERLSESEGDRKLREEAEKQRLEERAIEMETERQKKNVTYMANLFKEKFKLEDDVAIGEAEQYQEYSAQCKIMGTERMLWPEWLKKKGYEEIKQPKKVKA